MLRVPKSCHEQRYLCLGNAGLLECNISEKLLSSNSYWSRFLRVCSAIWYAYTCGKLFLPELTSCQTPEIVSVGLNHLHPQQMFLPWVLATLIDSILSHVVDDLIEMPACRLDDLVDEHLWANVFAKVDYLPNIRDCERWTRPSVPATRPPPDQ